jgi:hypothetical protein
MADTQVLREFFEWVDTDRDGLITVDEIKDACAVDINGDGTYSDQEKVQCARGWLQQFAQQDIDSNQTISFRELLAYNNVL